VHGGISSAVLRLADRDALLRAACRVAVEEGHFPFACAGVVDSATGQGEIVAHAGDNPAYLPDIRFAALPGYESPASRAAREQRLIVCNDVALERNLSVSREKMLAAGHRSIAACPLVVEGRTAAVLVLCAGESGFFDEEEVALLEWLRADLAFGLDHYEKARRLDYLAYYDAVTGLPNTHLFRDRLEQLIHGAPADSAVCLMLADLERFTLVNDSLGRDVGDLLLRGVGERLRGLLQEPFTVARVSADTFAIAHTCARAEAASSLRTQVVAALREPFVAGAHSLHLGIQAGIAIHPADGHDAETLFRNAEAALMEAKASAQPWVYFASELNVRMAEQLSQERELRLAIEQGHFELHYQPRVDLVSGRIVGVESLLRWRRPDGTLVLPGDFIQLAEDTGLIVSIGEWVLREACRQQATWLSQGLPVVPVGVNFSAVQFRRGNVLSSVQAALSEFALQGRHLEIELTETTAMEKPEEAATILTELRKLGVRAALDDFGTGFSSLSHLRRFPLSAVKIDRAFISDITRSPDDAAIANAVIAMAHGMGMQVVAEGVETQAQMQFLRTKQCDEMQGFAFSKPVSADEFASMLRGGAGMAMTPGDEAQAGTLLLVDDEAGIRNALQRTLRRCGYRILQAASGPEALELLALHSVQVIISDQRMPEMSGAEFLDIVRQLYPDTVRIILSGYTDLQVVTDGVNRGAVYRFFTKPWNDEELRHEVREAFRVAATKGSTPPAGEANRAT
jgi:diguanylate cyclase